MTTATKTRCKRSLDVRRQAMASTTAGVDVTIPQNAAAYTLRVVTAAGAGVAFTVELAAGVEFHFAAGEAWSEDRLAMVDDLVLTITSSDTAHLVELLLWRE